MLKHSACTKGKRVLVVMRDGRRFKDRFMEKSATGWIRLEEAGKLKLEDVRTFTIMKGE